MLDICAVAARIYEHLEDNRVEDAVMGCLRISRDIKDHLNAAYFMRELYPDKDEVARVLFDDTSNLKEEARKFVWEKSLDRWLRTHTLDLGPPGDEDKTVLRISAGELESELSYLTATLESSKLPHGTSSFDTAYFYDANSSLRLNANWRIRAICTIKARIKTNCLNYAVQIERQFATQAKSQAFLEVIQNDVNNYFKANSIDVYDMLQKAAQLVSSDDKEDAALLLTEVRRALKAATDFFYPPTAGTVVCNDGEERKMGDEQYLNRLQEFISTNFSRTSASDLVKAEINLLVIFFRKLNDIASKGVHSSATLGEAKQGLVGLYFLLSNVIGLTTHAGHQTKVS